MRSEQASRAPKQKIENLVRRSTWEFILEEEVPPGSNLIYDTEIVSTAVWTGSICDYWHMNFAEPLTNISGKKTFACDMSLSFRRDRGQITWLLASYFEDTFACDYSSFSQVTEATRKRFEVKPREYDTMRFSGVYLEKSDNGFNGCPKQLPSHANLVFQQQYRA